MRAARVMRLTFKRFVEGADPHEKNGDYAHSNGGAGGQEGTSVGGAASPFVVHVGLPLLQDIMRLNKF